MGLAATAAVLLVYLAGGLDKLELDALDLRFRYANATPESHDLVCLDIDDVSLDLVGRWPWPRDVQAALLDVFREAGVRALLIDITLGDAEFLRTILPRQADMAVDLAQLDASHVTLAYPDCEIRDALTALVHAYLATHYSAPKREAGVFRSRVWRDFLGSDAFEHLRALLQDGEEAAALNLARQIPPRTPRPGEPPWAPLSWAWITEALYAEPTLEGAALAERLGSEQEPDAPVVDACRAVALHGRVRAWLDEQPERWHAPPPVLLAQLNAGTLGEAPRLAELLAVTLRDTLGYHATVQTAPLTGDPVRSAAPAVDALAPVYYLHARAARRCGFVAFEPDVDGVMRWTRLLVWHGGVVLPQLALAVAWDELGLQPDAVTIAPGRLELRIPGRARPLVVQLDGEGRALVPWVARQDWTRQFGTHVPLGAAFQVFDRRQSIRHNNEQLLLGECADLLGELGHRDYVDDLQARLEMDGKLRVARCAGDVRAVQFYADLIPQYVPLLRDGLAALHRDLAQALAATTEPARRDRLLSLARVLNANAEYEAEIETLLGRLRGRVAGKIGLVGYTATALADMTPIPTHERAPGVIAHANLLNGLLTGHVVSWSPAWQNALLALAVGLVVTLLSVRFRPRAAGLLSAAAALVYVAAAAAVFHRRTHWIAVTPALGAVLVTYFAILLYRYMFLERESRQIATALSQYTSATLARQMAEDAELCKRAETREVTAMFTDLAGLTALSERIGAERTQRLLNVSLGRFVDVMLRHAGMVNKFIGDGIFAFWNPVILPQPDHARRACDTAVDLRAALHELVAEQGARGGDEAIRELVLRIGIATGRAVVGPCGSEQKYDYTCIGDSVNTAARLESANKFYGTRSLVNGATHAAVGEGFAFRPLGVVRVKGKVHVVPIFELLGCAGDVSAGQRQYAEQFGAAVAAFQARNWAAARRGFSDCLETRPDDLAARRYLDATAACAANTHGADWDAALELTEK